MQSTTKVHTVDSKGRVPLGKAYAGATLLVEHEEDGTIILRPAVTVPAAEAWIWQNANALASVRQGIEEAARRKHVTPPDLKAAAKLAARIRA